MIEISGIGIFTAFIAGLISFLSPCVLPLVPGYLSFIAGKSLTEINQEPDWLSAEALAPSNINTIEKPLTNSKLK